MECSSNRLLLVKLKLVAFIYQFIVKMQNIFRYYYSANINGMSDVKKPGVIYKPGA